MVEGGEELTGAALVAKAQEWADAGTMEPDVVGALADFTAHYDQWAGEDLAETVFVLLGGTSELCPLVGPARIHRHYFWHNRQIRNFRHMPGLLGVFKGMGISSDYERLNLGN